jgi:hypothetical protein
MTPPVTSTALLPDHWIGQQGGIVEVAANSETFCAARPAFAKTSRRKSDAFTTWRDGDSARQSG